MNRPVLVSFLLLFSLLPALAQEDPNTLFEGGNEAYRAGDFEQAILKYEQIRSAGLESGELYYNLGTACFRGDDLGRSVVNLHRALRFLPRDGDIRANLEYVTERTLDREIARAEIPPWKLARTIAGYFTRNEWLWASEGLYALSLAILALFLVRPALQPRLRDPLYIALGLLLIVATLFSISYYETAVVERGVVIDTEVPARSGPGEQFTREFLLHEGTVVRIHREADGWLYCSLSAEWKGWMPRKAVELI